MSEMAEYKRRVAITNEWDNAYKAWQLARDREGKDTRQVLVATIGALRCYEASMTLWIVNITVDGEERELWVGGYPRPHKDPIFEQLADAKGRECSIYVLGDGGRFVHSIKK
jgi:hypothetical protein